MEKLFDGSRATYQQKYTCHACYVKTIKICNQHYLLFVIFSLKKVFISFFLHFQPNIRSNQIYIDCVAMNDGKNAIGLGRETGKRANRIETLMSTKIHYISM